MNSKSSQTPNASQRDNSQIEPIRGDFMKNPNPDTYVWYAWLPCWLFVYAFAVCLNEFTEFRAIGFVLTIAFAACLVTALLYLDKRRKANLEKYINVSAGPSVIVVGHCLRMFTGLSISMCFVIAIVYCAFSITAVAIWNKQRKKALQKHQS